jgi:hypothetical protein
MELFHEIVDARAIVRFPNTVLKQVKVYRREGKVYVAHAGGFLRILKPFRGEDHWPTTNPNVTVIGLPETVASTLA